MKSEAIKNGKDGKIELLAPAGTPEAGYAALHYGADAVYLGLESFSARAAAQNFSLAELADITGYAHALPRRRNIYLALNTLILQSELKAMIDLLAEVAPLGVDAVIVQDLGVVHILRKYFPQVKIHASTQMAIHNRYGAQAAAEMGLRRITLARELTLSEIAEIAAIKEIETEVFIHGALCYSYSGLCLFSSHLYGRSGNRGQCAYPCREWFESAATQTNGRDGQTGGFIFSMKDLALPAYVAELRRSGVTALKIEGRMKSPLYVAAVVNYYRKLIDGSLKAGEEQKLAGDIKTIFSRPWTELYIKHRKNREVTDREIVGHRGLPAGQVEKIIKSCGGQSHSLCFQTALPLELHDGLQIDIRGLPRPFGFAVKNIYLPGNRPVIKSKRVFAAPAGALVEIPLPFDHPAIPLGAVIYSASSQKTKRSYDYFRPKAGQYRARQPADFEIKIDSNGFDVIARADVLSGGRTLPTRIEAKKHFTAALPPARDAKQVGAAMEATFRKLGNTNLQFGKIKVENPAHCFVPVSLLNSARREIAEELERKIVEIPRQYAARIKLETLSAVIPDPTQCVENSIQGGRACCPPRTAECRPSHRTVFGGSPRLGGEFLWSLKTDQPHLFAAFGPDDCKQVEEVIVELPADGSPQFIAAFEQLAVTFNREKIRLALPIIMRAWEIFPLTRLVADLIAKGWPKWQISNLGGSALLRSLADRNAKLDISADWPLYTLNRAAIADLQALGIGNFTLSPEDGLENMSLLLKEHAADATVIVYQDTPLMISETLVSVSGECSRFFTAARGEKLRVVNRGGRGFVLNSRPYCLAAHLAELKQAGAIYLRMDFMYRQYSVPEALDIWRQVRAGKAAASVHNANFYRGLG